MIGLAKCHLCAQLEKRWSALHPTICESVTNSKLYPLTITEDRRLNFAVRRAHGVRFLAVSQNIDTDESNPTSHLLLQILAAMANFFLNAR